MTLEKLKLKLETLSSGTYAEVVDLTGTHDHYQALIVSSAFEGKMTMDRHRLVFSLLEKEVGTEEIHALTLKTYTPDQYKKIKGE